MHQRSEEEYQVEYDPEILADLQKLKGVNWSCYFKVANHFYLTNLNKPCDQNEYKSLIWLIYSIQFSDDIISNWFIFLINLVCIEIELNYVD